MPNGGEATGPAPPVLASPWEDGIQSFFSIPVFPFLVCTEASRGEERGSLQTSGRLSRHLLPVVPDNGRDRTRRAWPQLHGRSGPCWKAGNTEAAPPAEFPNASHVYISCAT